MDIWEERARGGRRMRPERRAEGRRKTNADNRRNTGLQSVWTDGVYHHHQNTKARLLRMGLSQANEQYIIIAGSNRRPLLKDLLDAQCGLSEQSPVCSHCFEDDKRTKGSEQLAGQTEMWPWRAPLLHLSISPFWAPLRSCPASHDAAGALH